MIQRKKELKVKYVELEQSPQAELSLVNLIH